MVLDQDIPQEILDLIVYFSESYNNNSKLSLHAVYTMAQEMDLMTGHIKDYFGVLGDFNVQNVADLRGDLSVYSPVPCEPSKIYLVAAPLSPSRKIKPTFNFYAIPEAQLLHFLNMLKQDHWGPGGMRLRWRRRLYLHRDKARHFIEKYCRRDVALGNLPDVLLYSSTTVREIDTYVERHTGLLRECGKDEALVWSLRKSFMIEPEENIAILNVRAEEKEFEADEREYEQWIKRQPPRTPPGEPSDFTTSVNEEQIRSVCLQSWRSLGHSWPPFE